MARNRTAALRPPPPDTALAEVEEVFDPEKDARCRRVMEMLAAGSPEAAIFRAVVREFAVPHAQARADYADVRDAMRRHLDDEGAIDGVMLGSMARLQGLIRAFYEQALAPVPNQVLAFPDPDPDDPEGARAVYRPLTPGERASEVGARVAAAGVALKANEALVKIVGRRSQRWAEKPNTVITLGQGTGLSKEDREFLEGIGLVK